MAYDDPHYLRTDITRLDYFAAHAPAEIPHWFAPEPDPYTGPAAPVIPSDASDEDRLMLESWMKDPCFDLPEQFEWFEKAWEEHREAVRRHNEFQVVDRYLAWRWAYAEMMLGMREVYVTPDDEPWPETLDGSPSSLPRRSPSRTRRRT